MQDSAHTETRLSPGAAEALADNPGSERLVRALAGAPDAPAARAAASVAPSVLAVLRARRTDSFLRRLLRPAPAAAAAAAAVAAVLLFAPERRPASAPAQTLPAAVAQTAAPAALPETIRANPLSALPADVLPEQLIASQCPDGSWAPPRGDEKLAPAATGLAVLRLAASDAPGRDEALARAAAWLRSQQNADGSFGAATAPNIAAYNLALPAAALLCLYETGSYSELFTPIDGAVGSIRARLARDGDRLSRGDVWLAAALALADRLEWTDAHSGDLRRALRRIDASGDARFAAVADATSLAEKREALIALCHNARI